MRHHLPVLAIVLAAILLQPATSQAALTLNNIQHFSDAGGVWNNTNPGNWAIWVSPDSNPDSANPRPFLNEPNPLNNPIALPYGTYTLTLYKNEYASIDQGTVFTFQDGANVGNIVINSGAAYLNTNGPVPLTPGATVMLGSQKVSILSFGWYEENVFLQDFVGQQQNLGAGGGFDHVAVLTIQALVPEPATIGLALMGGLAMLGRRRRVA